MADEILIASSGAITTVTLNRPAKRNALNLALLGQLGPALAAAESDRAQRVLVLRGAGPVFCAGLDLAEAADPELASRSAELLGNTLWRLATTRLSTIAAVQGAAIAGGAGLMSACDFAFATPEAKFGFPEVRRGLVPALIMTFLRRQLRERDARELLLLGRPFDAAQAQALGLLNRVLLDAAALDAEVQGTITALLESAPSAIETTKRLLNELWPSPLATDLQRAHEHHLAARNSPAARAGIAAFNEQRGTAGHLSD